MIFLFRHTVYYPERKGPTRLYFAFLYMQSMGNMNQTPVLIINKNRAAGHLRFSLRSGLIIINITFEHQLSCQILFVTKTIKTIKINSKKKRN